MLPIMFIAAGYVAIGFGLFSKKFYAADVWGGDVGDKKPTSTWVGRIVFTAVGLFFILIGFSGLIYEFAPE